MTEIKNSVDNNLPSGPIKGGNVATLKHGYDVGVQGSAGVVMIDATQGGEIIPIVA